MQNLFCAVEQAVCHFVSHSLGYHSRHNTQVGKPGEIRYEPFSYTQYVKSRNSKAEKA